MMGAAVGRGRAWRTPASPRTSCASAPRIDSPRRSDGGDFSSASSDFKTLGTFFCPNVTLFLSYERPVKAPGGDGDSDLFALRFLDVLRRGSESLKFGPRPKSKPFQPRARVPHLVASRLPRPYHFPARIQSFQPVASPFPGELRFAVSARNLSSGMGPTGKQEKSESAVTADPPPRGAARREARVRRRA
jgi:hypothetical protein